MTQEQLHCLALNFIKGVGAVTAKTLVSYTGSPIEVFKASKSELLKIPGIGMQTAQSILDSNALQCAEEELALLQRNKIKFSCYLDPDYPSRLKAYENAPLCLFYKGQLNQINQRSVAVVGTRSPTEYGKMMTQKIITELQEYKVNIISGLAYGIDTIAHQQCVALDIPNYAILGNGLKKIYPAVNHQLSMKISKLGAVLSEFPFHTEPERENFPMRNRIIAGLSDVVVVIESKAKGGSIITANIANEYFKDVFAVPGKITNPKSTGCNKLIKEHKAALIESAKDIAYVMGWEKTNKKASQQMELPVNLSQNEIEICNLIRKTETLSFDQIHYELKIPISEISSILLNLEFKGLLRSLPGKKYAFV